MVNEARTSQWKGEDKFFFLEKGPKGKRVVHVVDENGKKLSGSKKNSASWTRVSKGVIQKGSITVKKLTKGYGRYRSGKLIKKYPTQTAAKAGR